MSSANETNDERRTQEQAASVESRDTGLSGEGAASAMAHLISQSQQHRHPPEAHDAAGSQRA